MDTRTLEKGTRFEHDNQLDFHTATVNRSYDDIHKDITIAYELTGDKARAFGGDVLQTTEGSQPVSHTVEVLHEPVAIIRYCGNNIEAMRLDKLSAQE